MLKKLAITSASLMISFSSFADKITDKAGSAELIYVDFWASWCGPCKASFPWMNEVNKEFAKKGIKIVAVNLDNKKANADKFLSKYPAEFEVVFDPKGELAQKYNVQGMPNSFLIDRNGKVLYKHIGFKKNEAGELKEKIESYLK